MSHARFIGGSFVLPKTHTSERTIPISDGLLYGLQQHKTQKRVRKSAMQLVFPNVDGRPYEATNLLRRVLHRALERGGL
jgi:integrase